MSRWIKSSSGLQTIKPIKREPIEWGHQVRSYVLAPYRMVKDLRTGVVIRDVERVLEGDLDELLRAALTARVYRWGGGVAIPD